MPMIMGILNVTPDSFSDGARYQFLEQAVERASEMAINGADIIDVGGESTRPGADEVSLSEEIDRVIPVIEAVKPLGKLISVDTSKPEVMEAAAIAGADIINDVRALSLPGALEVVAKLQLPVCLMHMQGLPGNMQSSPQYDDVVKEVNAYLSKRIEACELFGIERERIAIDPGFGFGKSLHHNLALLNNLSSFQQLGVSILAGLSRKSMLGEITGRKINERMPASIIGALIAMQNGAKIVRVHDIKETLDAKHIFLAMKALTK